MTDQTQTHSGSGPTHRSVEMGVALAMLIFSLIVIAGSLQAGIGWATEGPRAGFFPFYCALLVMVASVVNLFQAIGIRSGALFAEWGQIGQVMQVVVPGVAYVALVPYLGIYVSSVLLIGVFMRWIGKYSWPMVLGISIPVMVFSFIVFEKWFLVPLPKGPVEEFLGF